MNLAIEETKRRRKMQQEYNEIHGIIPRTIKKSIGKGLMDVYGYNDGNNPKSDLAVASTTLKYQSQSSSYRKEIQKLRKKMKQQSEKLEFEEAAKIRDAIKRMEIMELSQQESLPNFREHGINF